MRSKNPGGTAAYGSFALEKSGEIIEHGSGIIGSGPKMTNNLAEFVALARGLLAFMQKYPTQDLKGYCINVYGDSQLVIHMMNCKYRANKDKKIIIRDIY